MNRKYMNTNLKKATSYLARIVHKGNYLRGNPVIMKRVCGNKNCKCIREGKKHISLYICKKEDGNTRMTYVPKRLEDEVQEKIANYRKIKKLLERISELNYTELKIKKDKKIV